MTPGLAGWKAQGCANCTHLVIVPDVRAGHDALDAQKWCGKNEGEYHDEFVVDAAAQIISQVWLR